MSKNLILSFTICTISMAVGCGGEGAANSATNAKANTNTNAVTPVKLDPANMPPGLSASPMTPANVPANVANANKSTTSTPGIPSPAEMKKAAKPGTTPTPGIPSADEMRKAFSKPAANANSAAPPMSNSVPMMKSNRKLGGRPQ